MLYIVFRIDYFSNMVKIKFYLSKKEKSMKRIQIVSDEIVSLKEDFESTSNPDTYVRPNGDTAVLMGDGHCLLIRNDDNPVTVM